MAMKFQDFWVRISVAVAAAMTLAAAQANAAVSLNGAALTAEQRSQLEAAAGPVDDGAYWYDAYSGLIGPIGGPFTRQIAAGLDFPPMHPMSSDDGTGANVWTMMTWNGRHPHSQEVKVMEYTAASVWTCFDFVVSADLSIRCADRGYQPVALAPAYRAWMEAEAAEKSRCEAMKGQQAGSVWRKGDRWNEPGTHVGNDGNGCIIVLSKGYSREYCC